VAVRLDRRLAARIDPSDVVQETLADAAKRFDLYLRDRPLPFYPWLRQITQERLADVYRQHIRAGRRAAGDGQDGRSLPARSLCRLARFSPTHLSSVSPAPANETGAHSLD
jgi:RNA polymerase sigma-70 factor (ECF subfamily)